MVALWCVIGLAISAVSVSTLGAAFSIFGLRELFAGAALAVCAMAAALEFSKFVLAAYLHQRWSFLNIMFKTYLVTAVIVLSLITSMGIFGFLSNAYQSASNDLDTENVKLESLMGELARNDAEVVRLNKTVEDVPSSRVTKKMQMHLELEPELKRIGASTLALSKQIADANLKVLAVKQKVGPLIYISRAFNIPIDNVVKYLIIVLVSVFDPLAICLVIATSESLESRKKGSLEDALARAASEAISASVVAPVATPVASPVAVAVPPPLAVVPTATAAATAAPAPTPSVTVAASSDAPPAIEPGDQVLHMRFVDEDEKAS